MVATPLNRIQPKEQQFVQESGDEQNGELEAGLDVLGPIEGDQQGEGGGSLSHDDGSNEAWASNFQTVKRDRQLIRPTGDSRLYYGANAVACTFELGGTEEVGIRSKYGANGCNTPYGSGKRLEVEGVPFHIARPNDEAITGIDPNWDDQMRGEVQENQNSGTGRFAWNRQVTLGLQSRRLKG